MRAYFSPKATDIPLDRDAIQKLVIEIREKIISDDTTVLNSYLDDNTLVRFLEDTKYSVDESVKRVKLYIAYRKENCVDEMLLCPPHEDIFAKFTAGVWAGHDRAGHPVFYDRVGAVNQTLLFAEAGEKECVRRHMWFNENVRIKCQESSENMGELVTRAILVKDMKKLNLLPSKDGVCIFSKMSALERNMYPQNLHKVYMINSSWLVTTGWRLFKSFVNAETRSKIVFLGEDYAAQLCEDIGRDSVPIEYGGTLDVEIPTPSCIGPMSPCASPLKVDVSEVTPEAGEPVLA